MLLSRGRAGGARHVPSRWASPISRSTSATSFRRTVVDDFVARPRGRPDAESVRALQRRVPLLGDRRGRGPDRSGADRHGPLRADRAPGRDGARRARRRPGQGSVLHAGVGAVRDPRAVLVPARRPDQGRDPGRGARGGPGGGRGAREPGGVLRRRRRSPSARRAPGRSGPRRRHRRRRPGRVLGTPRGPAPVHARPAPGPRPGRRRRRLRPSHRAGDRPGRRRGPRGAGAHVGPRQPGPHVRRRRGG